MHINLPENTRHWIKIAEKFLETTQPWEVEAYRMEGPLLKKYKEINCGDTS